jgi:peptidoglycan/LPS O-acetylase OafA/YrhL
MKRIPELDGIRGIAIAMVLVWHYFASPASSIRFPARSPLWYLQAAGSLTWSGVDLFFVLSGFLIGGILLDSRDRPDYFRTFYVRRFFRIVPIYTAVLIVTHPLTSTVEHQAGPWWVYALFLQNFWMAATNDFGLWAVTWSLGVEEQFYLTLPAIVRFARNALPWIIGVGVVAAPIFRAALFYALPGNTVAPRALTFCRADTLLLGVAAAMCIRHKRAAGWLVIHANYLWTAGAFLLAGAGVMTLHRGWTYGIGMTSFGLTWLALLYSTTLLLAVTQPDSWLGAVLRFKPLRRLGMIAYGVYLLHQILFLAIKKVLPWSPPVSAIAALSATLAIALLSWRYFESPLIQRGHSLTREEESRGNSGAACARALPE